jgi:hypothetical protein
MLPPVFIHWDEPQAHRHSVEEDAKIRRTPAEADAAS